MSRVLKNQNSLNRNHSNEDSSFADYSNNVFHEDTNNVNNVSKRLRIESDDDESYSERVLKRPCLSADESSNEEKPKVEQFKPPKYSSYMIAKLVDTYSDLYPSIDRMELRDIMERLDFNFSEMTKYVDQIVKEEKRRNRLIILEEKKKKKKKAGMEERETVQKQNQAEMKKKKIIWKKKARFHEQDQDDEEEEDYVGKTKVYESDLSVCEDEDQDEEIAIPETTMVLNFFNDSPKNELRCLPGCSKRKADVIIAMRPFENWRDLVRKFKNAEHITTDLLNPTKDVLQMRTAIKNIMNKCEKISSEIQTFVSDIITGEGTTGMSEQPKILNTEMKLKSYQLIGLNWLVLMHDQQLNGVLADEMDLGKTVQAIAFLAYLKEMGELDGRMCLIVVPTSTLDNWARELSTWLPSVGFLTYHGSEEERKGMRMDIINDELEDNVGIILTTYNVFSSSSEDKSLFKRFSLHTVIYDEAHMLNMTSLRYENLMKIRCARRLLVTGTPLPNNLVELISMLAFVMPQLFEGRKEEWKKVFSMLPKNDTEKSKSQYVRERIQQAKRIMAPFFLRRLKGDVLKKDESCDSNDDYKTEIEINEESFGFGMENANNPESLKQIPAINERKDLIEECPNKYSDAFERKKSLRNGHHELRKKNKETEYIDIRFSGVRTSRKELQEVSSRMSATLEAKERFLCEGEDDDKSEEDVTDSDADPTYVPPEDVRSGEENDLEVGDVGGRRTLALQNRKRPPSSVSSPFDADNNGSISQSESSEGEEVGGSPIPSRQKKKRKTDVGPLIDSGAGRVSRPRRSVKGDECGAFYNTSEYDKYQEIVKRHKDSKKREGKVVSKETFARQMPYPLGQHFESLEEVKARYEREREKLEQRFMKERRDLQERHRSEKVFMAINEKHFRVLARSPEGFNGRTRFRTSKPFVAGAPRRNLYFCPIYSCLGIFQNISRHRKLIHKNEIETPEEIKVYEERVRMIHMEKVRLAAKTLEKNAEVKRVTGEGTACRIQEVHPMYYRAAKKLLKSERERKYRRRRRRLRKCLDPQGSSSYSKDGVATNVRLTVKERTSLRYSCDICKKVIKYGKQHVRRAHSDMVEISNDAAVKSFAKIHVLSHVVGRRQVVPKSATINAMVKTADDEPVSITNDPREQSAVATEYVFRETAAASAPIESLATDAPTSLLVPPAPHTSPSPPTPSPPPAPTPKEPIEIDAAADRDPDVGAIDGGSDGQTGRVSRGFSPELNFEIFCRVYKTYASECKSKGMNISYRTLQKLLPATHSYRKSNKNKMKQLVRQARKALGL